MTRLSASRTPIRFTATLVAALLLIIAAIPRPLAAQEETAGGLSRAALGAGLGLVGGVGITLANVVARAHWQNEYLNEPGDLLHWQTVPMILAPATGAAFGLHSWETLGASVLGATAGLGVGVGVGALLGSLTMDTREGPWAGGVMGGGWGLAIGGLVGGYLGWREADAEGPVFSVALRVPTGPVLGLAP